MFIFSVGERGRVLKEMERNMKGYRELRKEVEVARQHMKEIETMRNNGRMEKTVQTSFYKSPVGTRSSIALQTHQQVMEQAKRLKSHERRP